MATKTRASKVVKKGKKKGLTNAEKAQMMIDQLVTTFEDGNIAAPLARTILLKDVDIPMQKWSYLNRLFCLLSSATDARGFRQWQEVGRTVTKGEKSHTFIRIPCRTAKEQNDDGEDKKQQIYFRWLPLFDLSQTEGEPLEYEQSGRQYIETLPLIEVAKAWNLDVNPLVDNGIYNGFYQHGAQIALAVENVSTWLHELVHAADDRRGTLTKGRGQKWDNEVVAQLGACVLAHLIGRPEDADEGKTFYYIKGYAEKAGKSVASACTEMIERTAAAVDLILAEANV